MTEVVTERSRKEGQPVRDLVGAINRTLLKKRGVKRKIKHGVC